MHLSIFIVIYHRHWHWVEMPLILCEHLSHELVKSYCRNDIVTRMDFQTHKRLFDKGDIKRYEFYCFITAIPWHYSAVQSGKKVWQFLCHMLKSKFKKTRKVKLYMSSSKRSTLHICTVCLLMQMYLFLLLFLWPFCLNYNHQSAVAFQTFTIKYFVLSFCCFIFTDHKYWIFFPKWNKAK